MPTDEADLAALIESLRVAAATGYRTRADLVETVLDEYPGFSGAEADTLAGRVWADRAAEQATWPPGVRTDPERLTRAFDLLGAAGITAREHFACCRSCGEAEIGAEREPDSHGYVYFHAQSTEHAVAGGPLRLYYGAFLASGAEPATGGAPADRATAEVGRQIVATLAEVGLATEWDGDPKQAISVTPVAWRRRLPE